MNKKLIALLSATFIINISAHRILKDISKFLPENPVILEAGSYDGDIATIMSEMWPKGTIHTFEPVPLLFLKTKAKNFNRKNVRCYQIALGKNSGRAPLYVSINAQNEISQSSSLLEPKDHLRFYQDIKFNNSIEVQTMNLDEWATENSVDHIDLMWLDIQGAEFDMLKAAPHMLKKVKLIYTKIAFAETYKNIPLYSQVRPWLESNGFTVIFDEVCGSAKAEGYALFIRIS